MALRPAPFLLLALSACATVGNDGPPPLLSVGVIDERDQESTLAYALGKVVVVDVCAAWSDACLANATAFSRVCTDMCGDDVELVTLLLDDIAGPARQSYRTVLEVKHRVLLPTKATLDGESALGVLSGIPRVVFFDRAGRVVDDVSGAVVSEDGLRAQIRELL